MKRIAPKDRTSFLSAGEKQQENCFLEGKTKENVKFSL